MSRAVAARRAVWRAGGRKRLEYLRRWEVSEGREADKSGRWRLRKIVQVMRPDKRHGRQLRALIQWNGVNPMDGTAWPDTWVDVNDKYMNMNMTADMRKVAKSMEDKLYPRETEDPEEDTRPRRKSQRLNPEAEGGGQ